MSRVELAALERDIRRRFASSGPARGGPGAVGTELELIPLRRPPGARPAVAAPPSAADDRVLDRLTAALRARGRFTFEPGGQLEYSTPALASVAGLTDEMGSALDPLCAAAAAEGIELAARGLGPWFGPDETGLRRPSPRYVQMDRYFRRLGPWGPWMMRLTASLQVNLDFGPPAVAARRWRAANVLSPVLIATFANSAADLPGGVPVAAGRAWVWSRLDPSRTGVLGRPASTAAPWAEYLAFALRARVMFDARMRSVALEAADGAQGDSSPRNGAPRFEGAPRFDDWWLASVSAGDVFPVESTRRAASARSGPTLEDWRVHLTTLFPDARPRGWLEIRSIDVPQRPWWPVPAALLCALLYDDRALGSTLELLDALSSPAESASALAARAARHGLKDEGLRAAAAELFGIAEAAMDRFPAGWFGPVAGAATAGFRERYVEAGRTQADEARARDEVARLPAALPSLADAAAVSIPRTPA